MPVPVPLYPLAMNNTRRNTPGKLSTPAQVIKALNLRTDGAGIIHACAFVTYIMADAGADLSPSHLAGIIKTTALHFVELEKAYPEKAASLPMLHEAKALVSLLPL